MGASYRLSLPRDAMRGATGERLGLTPGSSLDFHDYREYQPGDDLRRLDWSVYARSDKEIVKLFQEEVSPKLEIILDTSRSMDLPDTAKAATTLALCAALATAAYNARCACAVWCSGGLEGERPRSPATDGDVRPPNEMLTLLPNSSAPPELLPPIPFTSTAPPHTPIASSSTPFRRNSIRVFISDLMFPAPPENILRRLRDHAAALTIIQVLTDSKTSPRPSGSVRLEDIESNEILDLTLDETACSAYRSTLASHREEWNRESRRCGATFIPLNADTLDLTPLVKNGLIET